MADRIETPENQFEKNFQVPKLLLLLSGIKLTKTHWNKYLDHFIHNQIFYYNAIVLYIVVYGEIYAVIDCVQSGKPFVLISSNLPCITNCVLGTTKAAFVYLNKGTVIDILYELKDIHTNSYKEDQQLEWVKDRRKLIKESVKIFNLIIFVMMAISIIVQVTFCLLPGFLMAYSYIKTGESPIMYPFIMKYNFFDVYESSWWLLIYVHQVLATAIAIANLFGCDILFFAVCFYIDMYFRVLCLEFENTVSLLKQDTQKNLRKAIRRHQQLINLVNKTEQVFSKPTLCHLSTASMSICLSSFIITIADEMSVVCAYITLLTMALSQISLICYFPDILMRSSGLISESVYKSAWYNSDEEAKKIMLLVMLRSKKACKLTAWGFVDLNLRAFTRILSTAYSYFALLRTMYN